MGLRADIKNDSYTPKRIGLEDPSLRIRVRPSCRTLDLELVTHVRPRRLNSEQAMKGGPVTWNNGGPLRTQNAIEGITNLQ